MRPSLRVRVGTPPEVTTVTAELIVTVNVTVLPVPKALPLAGDVAIDVTVALLMDSPHQSGTSERSACESVPEEPYTNDVTRYRCKL